MNGTRIAMLAFALVAGSVALAQAPAGYSPGPHNITLPPDWETRFVRYAVVDRADRKIIRHMYANPEAFAAARAGEPLPHGSLFIMADTNARLGPDGTPLRDQQGRMIPIPGWIALGVQEKRAGWGEGYSPEKRNGEWEYARFFGDGRRNEASVEACFTCHIQARAQQDFTFNFWDYVQTRR
jgi:hypothetical protein